MTTTLKTSARIEDASIGSFIWWDLDGARVKPAALQNLLNAHGYPYVVPQIDPERALKRACSSWSQGRLTRGDSEKYKAEVVKIEKAPGANGYDRTEVSIGILKREQIGDKRVGWAQVELIAFAWDEGSPYQGGWVKSPVSDEAKAFVDEADLMRTHIDHSWIRPKFLAAELNRMSSITVRRQGGIYYVPNVFLDEVAKLQEVVSKLGNSALHVARIGNDEGSVKAVSGEVQHHFTDAVADLQGKLEKWRESSRKVRSDAAANMLTDLSDLLSRAALYEDALQIKLDDFAAEITECRREALRLISEGSEAA